MKDYIQKLIHTFTAFKHEEEVTREVHQWLLNGKHVEEKEVAMQAVWEDTEGKADASTWMSLETVYNKVGVNKEKMQVRHIHFWRYAAVAVVLLAVSVGGTFYLTKQQYAEIAMVEYMTKTGELNQVQLPDGSIVETNSGTILFYPEKFSGNTRTIYLIGEANFKVKKNPNKPFIVRSATMAVTALGTEFNVAAYPECNEIIVSLIHGKVKVDCNNGKETYILNPGQQVRYARSEANSKMENANLEDVTAWQRGLFVFRGMAIKDVLLTLERRYAVTFQYNANVFNEDKYNFRFREKASIEEIMNILQEVVGGFDYQLEGNRCSIKTTKKR